MGKSEVLAHERFQRALQLQDQGVSRNDIYIQLGYSSIDSLTRYMRKQGYKYNKEEQKYVKTDSNTKSNTACNIEDGNTKSNTICNVEDSNTNVQSLPNNEIVLDNDRIAVLNILQEEQHTLLSMLEWYKQQVSNTCNTNSNTNSNTLLMKVQLPKSENILISSRVNKEVWGKFKEFTKRNNDFTSCDLLSQALVDFMAKYSEFDKNVPNQKSCDFTIEGTDVTRAK